MNIKYAILGFLSWRPFSGYSLKKLFVDVPFIYWSGNNNQIYKTLVQLHREELVTHEIHHQKTGPSKKVYTITEMGKLKLKNWVSTTLESPQLKNTFLIQLAWADQLSNEQLMNLFEKYEHEILMQVLMVQEKKRRNDTNPARTEREKFFWEKITDNCIASYQQELEWVKGIRKDLHLHLISADTTHMAPLDTQLITALTTGNATTRLKAALEIGTNPEPGLIYTLLARCAFEPDFYVRDVLTWALTRFPSEVAVPRLLEELHSERAQARSQALHTLSKIKDPATWSAITKSLLRDPDDEVARSAWRASVVLVPDGQKKELAEELVVQFGRGSREVQLSLSRALVALGGEVVEPILLKAMTSDFPSVQAHARATERLLRDPTVSFDLGVQEAKRVFTLGKNRKT